MVDGAEVQVATGSSNSDGAISFTPITFTEAGTYTYVMRELQGENPTITYSDTLIGVDVYVTDEGGQLVADTLYYGDAYFLNKYTPTAGSINITATKILEGRALRPGEFTFILLDQNGQTVARTTNNIDGSINFDAINYTQTGVYNYTIREVRGYNSTIIYDEEPIDVTVEVTEVNDALVATATYGEKRVFENSYTPREGEVILEADKKVNGRQLRFGEFQFEIIDPAGKVVSTGTNDFYGNVRFSPINFTKAGTYGYTIREVVGNNSTITYDPRTFNATILVKDINDRLVIDVVYHGNNIFVNEYLPKPSEMVLKAHKELIVAELDERVLEDSEFNFEVLNEAGEVVSTATNDADGTIVFDAIHFTTIGTYTYTIREVATSDETITYDNTMHTVTIEVTDNDGQLEEKS